MERARDIGELAVELRLASSRRVVEARAEQARLAREGRRAFIAELLIVRGVITADQLLALLEKARGYREISPDEESGPTFGDVAVRKGYVTPAQLYRALQTQRDEDAAPFSHRLLGDVLVKRGHMSPWAVEDVVTTLADLSAGVNRTGETPSEAFPVGPQLYGGGELYARRYPRDRVRSAREQALATQAACGARVLVRDVMGKALTTTPDTRLGIVLDLVEGTETDSVLVLEDGAIAGVVAVWDVRDLDRATPVGSAMSASERTVSPHTSIREAARILRESGLPCLPVVARDALIGVVTKQDLRRAGMSPDELEEPPPPFEELGAGD